MSTPPASSPTGADFMQNSQSVVDMSTPHGASSNIHFYGFACTMYVRQGLQLAAMSQI
jgi:hypothetical protein